MKPAASTAAGGGSGSAGGPDGDGDAPDLQTVQEKGQKVVEWFLAEAGKLRGAAPSPDMLDNVQVEAYGELVPLPQVAQVALRQGSKLVVAPFDPSVSAMRPMPSALRYLVSLKRELPACTRRRCVVCLHSLWEPSRGQFATRILA